MITSSRKLHCMRFKTFVATQLLEFNKLITCTNTISGRERLHSLLGKGLCVLFFFRATLGNPRANALINLDK